MSDLNGLWESKWLFRLLDYEHWNISYVGIDIALVVLNGVDQSVSVQTYSDMEADKLPASSRRYTFWRRWLREHEVPYEPDHSTPT